MTEKKTTAIAKPIPMNEDLKIVTYMAGAELIELKAKSVEEFLCKPTKSGKKPSRGDVVKYMMQCKAMHLNPWVGDCFLVGYDGKDGAEFSLISSHSSLLKRADTIPEYEGISSGIIVRRGQEVTELEGLFRDETNEVLLGAWAEIHVKGKNFGRKRVNLSTFKKGNKFWERDEEGMVVKCVEAAGLRQAFPSPFQGAYIAAEMQGIVDITGQVEILPKEPPESSVRPQLESGVPKRKKGGTGLATPDDEPEPKPEPPPAKKPKKKPEPKPEKEPKPKPEDMQTPEGPPVDDDPLPLDDNDGGPFASPKRGDE